MFRLSAKSRIAMGMAMLVVTVLMLVQISGVIPDHREQALRSRCAISELVALQVRPVILEGDLGRMEALLKAIVRRNEEILSGAVRRSDDVLVTAVGDHEELWDTEATGPDDHQVYVPLHTNGEVWGQVEICFLPLVSRGLAGVWESPAFRLITMTGLLCWVTFHLYLRKMLSHLDPSRAVPDRVRSALDTLGDGLMVLDRDERVVLVNRSLAESIGISAEKLMGVRAEALPWGAVSGDREEGFPWSRALSANRGIQGETIGFRRESREDAIFLTSCSPVPGSDGQPQGVLVSLDDVTELEETKQQLSHAKDAAEAASQAKSSFLANMSHEIRTPMNAILGFTEVLRRDIERDESKRRKHLNTIHSSGTHLLNLINDILDLSKVEADRLEVESIPCAVHHVIADVATVMGGRAEEKGIALETQFDGPIPESIQSDPARLRQILTNLIGNAIKFTEQGSVRVVTRLVADSDTPRLVIDVIDTGIGMNAESVDKIFDPFSQADASVTRRFGGTGLGLSISKRFAEALGGGIEVQSSEGTGSVFSVTIATGSIDGVNLILPTTHEIDQRGPTTTSTSPQLQGLKILVVDDGEENRDLMCLVLEEAGGECETAEDGEQAVASALSGKWDVILMDMQMPVMDGYTATRQLRQEGYDKPIIALTAHAMQQAEQECLDAGCSGFLTKPIDIDKLLGVLADHRSDESPVLEVSEESSLSDGVAPGDILNTAAIDCRAGKPPETAEESAPVVDESPSDQSDVTAASAEARSHDVRPTRKSDRDPAAPVRSTLPVHKPRFRAIVDRFVDRLDERFDAMELALNEGDTGQLADLGHALKGAGANCGFQPVAVLAAALESSAKDEDLESILEILSALRSLRSRIEVAETDCVEAN